MKSIRISNEAYLLVQQEAALMSRSIAQQFEHWVRLGMCLEASDLTATQVKGLLQGVAPTQDAQSLPAVVRQAVDLIGGRLAPDTPAPRERTLRRQASTLLKKHFGMPYGELAALAMPHREQLAREVLTAEARERLKP